VYDRREGNSALQMTANEKKRRKKRKGEEKGKKKRKGEEKGKNKRQKKKKEENEGKEIEFPSLIRKRISCNERREEN